MVLPSRVLFCGTLEGKVSMVRQLEPDLHVDAAAATVDALQRFTPQLLHVRREADRPAAPAQNVGSALSLAKAFAG